MVRISRLPLVLQACFGLSLLKRAIKIYPLENSLQASVRKPFRIKNRSGLVGIEDLVWATHIAGRLVGATCLPKSIWLSRKLKALGFPSEIKLGVRKSDDGQTVAHAWVEVGSVNIFDNEKAPKYEVISTLWKI